MDASGAQTMCAGGGRSSRVVLSPRRWGQVVRDDRSATVANKPDTPGRARSSRKEPSCRECRIVSATCGDYACGPPTLFCPRGCGCASARHSLRPLSSEGHGFSQSPGAIRAAGMRRCVFNFVVIPGRERSERAIGAMRPESITTGLSAAKGSHSLAQQLRPVVMGPRSRAQLRTRRGRQVSGCLTSRIGKAAARHPGLNRAFTITAHG